MLSSITRTGYGCRKEEQVLAKESGSGSIPIRYENIETPIPIPIILAICSIAFPGTTSPYPTVVTVLSAQYKAVTYVW